MFKSVTDTIAIGSLSQAKDLQEVAQKAYKSVIDLCPAAEGTQLDAAMVEACNLAYTAVPISPKNLTPETLAAFKQAVHNAPQPIYVRCASGLRAGVFTLLTLADQENWSEAQYLERLQSLGIEHKPGCALASFAQRYFENKGEQH